MIKLKHKIVKFKPVIRFEIFYFKQYNNKVMDLKHPVVSKKA
jgi:hypothetical protein